MHLKRCLLCGNAIVFFLLDSLRSLAELLCTCESFVCHEKRAPERLLSILRTASQLLCKNFPRANNPASYVGWLSGVGFSLAGLDRTKFGFLEISAFFVYCCHSDIDFTENCVLINFHS